MLTALHEGRADVTIAGRRLSGDDLTSAAGAVAARISGANRVAVITEPVVETVVAVAGVLAAGACVVPLNPHAGDADREHVLRDAAPDVVLEPADVDLTARADLPSPVVEGSSPALIVYTSGTTGPPKGAVIPRRAIAACLDGLARRWEHSADDVFAHGLPLFHVHGLVLGTLGPLRLGARLTITPTLQPVSGATVYYAVPTAWGRLDDATLTAMTSARLLVSGSAALPAPVFERVRRLSGHPLVERYGLTETLIVTAATAETAAAGHVGTPLDGVDLRISDADADGMGEVQLAGPTLFSGYLNRPDALAATMSADGWLRTGDLGRWDPETGLQLLGRMATDLIKTGGFKVGAGEVEDALLAHPDVLDVAVIGEPDDDLGERIVAYVVIAHTVDESELIAHVANTTAPHKRPRVVRFVDALPRNHMGKIQKSLLRP